MDGGDGDAGLLTTNAGQVSGAVKRMPEQIETDTDIAYARRRDGTGDRIAVSVIAVTSYHHELNDRRNCAIGISMHGATLNIVLIFLLAAVLVVPLFKRFGLGGVLGYLVTGILLGPHALRVVNDPDRVLAAAEVGVVMMLFVIGLELSLPRL